VVRIINEPTAAALVYEAAQHQGKRILVYDLGGGTFDVSVVRIEAGVVEVISSHGNNHLGGDDFDNKIVQHVLEHLKLKHGLDVSDQPRAMARILRSAETAKKHLSDHPYARIEEEYLTEHDGKPVNLDLELSRLDYEDMITPFIEETLGAIHIALESAGLISSRIDEILLVGGATRTPLIRRRLVEGSSGRGRSGPLRRHGGGYPGSCDGGHRGIRSPGGCHALYVRHQRTGRVGRRPVPLSILSDHPQEHPDPGAAERSVLHRRRRADRG
jgi:molecular chaperone DnaK